ncbi:uncharacterized protein LOC117648115 [Thrips palmi]|uniref:Uncharacterized protein LOC117648115 n=1 Tax=Thrips palmi TaxID=161013 RepID=A0A6P8ZQQ1_THRPL|nr:uncharacterized protein LOC117648115 [Thrips palmi]
MAAPEDNHVWEEGDDDGWESYYSSEDGSSSSGDESVVAGCSGDGGAEDGIPTDLTQDGHVLLTLPGHVLLLVCRQLRGKDLVRLGLVCRGLRVLARCPRVWRHVDWAEDDGQAVIRVAPALRSVSPCGTADALRLLRAGTPRVRVFELDHEEDGYTYDGNEIDQREVMRVLQHYKGNLQVVRLGTLWDLKVLDAIDALGVKELYVNGSLAKTYPGSSKVVKRLSFWREASGEVACRLVRAAKATLQSFHIDSFRLYKNHVACSPEVATELLRCSALRSASMPTYKPSLLSGFPNMKKLCLYEFGLVDHAAVKRALQSAAGRRNRQKLERLTLCLGHLGHRGLVQEVAAGCPALRTLCLRYQAMSDGTYQHDYQVDVARDLHAILAPLTELETLILEAARVPCSVFRGLERGALPELKRLELKYCGVTPKGKEAFAALKANRPDLAVVGVPRKACLDGGDGGFVLGFPLGPPETRCRKGVCAEASDCEDADDDPAPSGGEEEEDEDVEEEEEDFETFRQLRPGETVMQLLERLATRYVDPMMDDLLNAPGLSDDDE